ncbi:MAG TPA: hypothetical protein VK447_10790 [Myxococcaceae bacterium]|nr:hypothetical protein [Myxococcaceae bacterium]
MENGRWARFQRCTIVNSGHQDFGDEVALLVAVELDEHYQELLTAAETSLESYRQRGIPVQLRLDPDGKGKLSLSFEPAPEGAAVH